jgi:hypothetical protein
MKRGALFLPAACLGLGSQPATAQPPVVNDVPITITWQGRGPTSVAFEDSSVGRIEFTPKPGRFVGHRRTTGNWAIHVVTLNYSGDDFPLALRTRFDNPGVTLRIDTPDALACNQTNVAALEQVSEAGPQATRMRALLQARQMLGRPISLCTDFGKRRLARVYFRMSCSLARDTGFFAVSEEAKYYLRRTARPPADAENEIRQCEAAIRRAVASATDPNPGLAGGGLSSRRARAR